MSLRSIPEELHNLLRMNVFKRIVRCLILFHLSLFLFLSFLRFFSEQGPPGSDAVVAGRRSELGHSASTPRHVTATTAPYEPRGNRCDSLAGPNEVLTLRRGPGTFPVSAGGFQPNASTEHGTKVFPKQRSKRRKKKDTRTATKM